jgi:hypothetical protein
LPLKQKSDAAEAFDRFIDTDVRPRGYVARSVRCDSGGEFFGNEFRDVCAQRGIHFDPAAARTPSQNSISESSVRVLEATARCLALESGAPASFWPFMMAAAALTNNCLSTAAVGLEGGAVPWQRWHGTAPPLSGCVSLAVLRGSMPTTDESAAKATSLALAALVLPSWAVRQKVWPGFAGTANAFARRFM